MAQAERHRPPRSKTLAVAVIVSATVVVVAVSAIRRSGADAASGASTSTIPVSATPLTLLSSTPAAHAINVGDTDPMTLTFSAPLLASSATPRIAPAVVGAWSRPRPDELRFTPTSPILPLQQVTVTVPAGTDGPIGTGGQRLARPLAFAYTVAPGSTLRLQELLAELDYLPVAFTVDHASTDVAATVATTPGATSSEALGSESTEPAAISLSPRPGSFAWRFDSVPAQLKATFAPGIWGTATLGAVVAFQSEHGLALDGSAGPKVWAALLAAVAQRAPTTRPYDYLLVTETLPETLYVWREGNVILQTPVNTGVPGAATALGTFPVYLRFTSTTMSGQNPDGTHYVDPGVPWVSYFNGSDAVHGFPRVGYGYPQSDGCVEVPIATAAQVYPTDPYGTLVTVTTGDLATELGVPAGDSIVPPTSSTTTSTTTTPVTTTTEPQRRPSPTTTSTTTTSTTTTSTTTTSTTTTSTTTTLPSTTSIAPPTTTVGPAAPTS